MGGILKMKNPTDEEIQKANEEYEIENQDRLRMHTPAERLRIKRIEVNSQ
jgi:hypothetical protein